ncbi:MAG TPA: GAF domain-containing sensor histidine kinase, partial [Polyangiales bacterium]
LIVEVTACEKVDAFLHDPTANCLVATGTSLTPLAQLQKRLGLDRLPIANGDPMTKVFTSGRPYLCGHVETDPDQPRGIAREMGVRSMVGVPLDVAGVRRGVLSLASIRNDAFTPDDLSFLRIVSIWIGTLVHRSELAEQATVRTAEQSRQVAAEELITVLAHDLRNMLNPIAARLGLLLTRAEQENRKPDIDDCERAIAVLHRFEEVMSDLLDVSRLERSLFSLNMTRFDLLELTSSIAQALTLPDVEIRVDCVLEPPQLVGDRRRLRQALENVISNATKHSPRGEAVLVKIARCKLGTQDAAQITIIDHGPGVAPELLPRIFDRYVSGGRSSGLGLGLYLARGVVAAHGGTISLAPAKPRGAQCEIVLPLVAAAES